MDPPTVRSSRTLHFHRRHCVLVSSSITVSVVAVTICCSFSSFSLHCPLHYPGIDPVDLFYGILLYSNYSTIHRLFTCFRRLFLDIMTSTYRTITSNASRWSLRVLFSFHCFSV
ncbi:hypothetical protein AA313_de0204841 [Arthrobotrys entomopaga]|nr:hypothetical protein AA313_de0204841 [Arthrobotrys entomopaga]